MYPVEDLEQNAPSERILKKQVQLIVMTTLSYGSCLRKEPYFFMYHSQQKKTQGNLAPIANSCLQFNDCLYYTRKPQINIIRKINTIKV